jgi:hypothetical protein
MELTQERLRKLFDYNPTTGQFKRLVTVSGLAKAGMIAGTKTYDGYLQIGIDGKAYKAHRLAFLYMVGRFPRDQVDHKNGVRNDNSWANLRECSVFENHQNRKKSPSYKTSNHIGVGLHKQSGGWLAHIQANGEAYRKWHKTEAEAVAWRREMKAKLHTFQPIDRP